MLRSDAAVTPRTLRRCASRLASASTTVAFVERRRADLFFGKGTIIIYYTAADLVLADAEALVLTTFYSCARRGPRRDGPLWRPISTPVHHFRSV